VRWAAVGLGEGLVALEWSTSPTTRSSEDAINQSEACGR
jgi:hypothetical protein